MTRPALDGRRQHERGLAMRTSFTLRTSIAVALVSICREHARWQYYFGSNGLTPLPLLYEDILALRLA